MTKARLLEAIAAYDPDGQGLERVKTAAAKQALACASPGSCLLSVAWDAEVYWGELRSRGWVHNPDSYTKRFHTFDDVIEWFDNIGTFEDESSEAVLELLNE